MMRTVRLRATVDFGPSAAYERLAGFTDYPKYAEAVRSVEVSDLTESNCISRWAFAFRGGLLRWTETDTFDRAAGRIDFDQVEGDLEVFIGYWQVSPLDDGSEIIFSLLFDLGLPTLAEFLEPVAANATIENMTNLLIGLFGPAAEITIEIDEFVSDATGARR
jgi:ribosome-associated toxin RatA of RatAB toxin-antitoxin module